MTDKGCCSGRHSGLHVNSTLVDRIVILMRFEMSKTTVLKRITYIFTMQNSTRTPTILCICIQAKLPEVGKSDFTTGFGKLIFIKL